MAKGCRDCKRCTEAAGVALVKLPVRLAWNLTGGIATGLLRKKCPQCGHNMADRHMVEGRFQD